MNQAELEVYTLCTYNSAALASVQWDSAMSTTPCHTSLNFPPHCGPRLIADANTTMVDQDTKAATQMALGT
jgi:hypothetical protein